MKTDWVSYWKNYSLFEKLWVCRITRAYKKLLNNVKINNVKILELGSGSGINSLIIAKKLKANKITLVDFNEKAIEISKEKFKNSSLNVKFLKRDILNLILKEKFDIIHSEGLIEHFYGNERL